MQVLEVITKEMASLEIRLVSIALVVNKKQKIERCEESYFIRTTSISTRYINIQVRISEGNRGWCLESIRERFRKRKRAYHCFCSRHPSVRKPAEF